MGVKYIQTNLQIDHGNVLCLEIGYAYVQHGICCLQKLAPGYHELYLFTSKHARGVICDIPYWINAGWGAGDGVERVQNYWYNFRADEIF